MGQESYPSLIQKYIKEEYGEKNYSKQKFMCFFSKTVEWSLKRLKEPWKGWTDLSCLCVGYNRNSYCEKKMMQFLEIRYLRIQKNIIRKGQPP